MDVSTPQPITDALVEPVPRRFARAEAPPATPPATPPGEPSRDRPAAPGEGRWEARSTLKFSLTAADVDARFEIHQATSRVTVTMYDRETGEVLREIPSRRVLDTVAAITATGLRVDETT